MPRHGERQLWACHRRRGRHARPILSGCNLKNGGEDLVNGKKLFVKDCGICHTLQRAGARGVTGPNLDEAFQQARKDGMKDSTFAGVVEGADRAPQP